MAIELPTFFASEDRHLNLGERLALRLLVCKYCPVPEIDAALIVFFGAFCLLAPAHGHNDSDTALALAHLAPQLLPGDITCDLGTVRSLGRDKHDVGPRVPVEAGLGVQIAAEGLAVVNLGDSL